MSEPIPFAGWVETEENMDKLLKELTGADPENMPKYVILGDGTVYFYRKEEDKYALCEQTKTIQKRV
jgi:hypothetical protein